jgi:hypothetical protein
LADKKSKQIAPKSEGKKDAAQAKSAKIVKVAEPVQKTAAESKPAGRSSSTKYLIVIAAIIAIAIIAVIYVYPGSIVSTVPFSTFKSNMQSSPRVSIAVTYTNQSQLANESGCFTSIVQVVAHSRQAATIDFFLIDNQQNTCTYSDTGLGGSVNPITTNSTYCLSKAYSEDGIFLNYSSSNATMITSNHAFVYGNNAYLAQCPIAVELS